MSSLSHDDVFALRLELTDEYLDENIIIKELKLILLQNGFENEDIVNQFLVDFYKKFGFDISLETIKSININPIQPPQSVQMLNSLINHMYIQTHSPSLQTEMNNIPDMLNGFNQIMNLIHNTPAPQMNDVKVTLKDESKIKKYKLDCTLDSKCSFCMNCLDKDEGVWELQCGHVFHQDCIKKWLKEYSYKCPICRKETGEGHVNI
tara:strand:- start:512 stop:1129 length:618 start_codon:yes stop_codon:yes gene_type:complete